MTLYLEENFLAFLSPFRGPSLRRSRMSNSHHCV